MSSDRRSPDMDDDRIASELRAAFIAPMDESLAQRHLARMRAAATPGPVMRWIGAKVLAAALMSVAGVAAASVAVVKVAGNLAQEPPVIVDTTSASSAAPAPSSGPRADGDAVTGTVRPGKGASRFELNGTVTASSGGSLTVTVRSASASLDACGIDEGGSATIAVTGSTRVSPPKAASQDLTGRKVHAGGTIGAGCVLTAAKLNVSQGQRVKPTPAAGATARPAKPPRPDGPKGSRRPDDDEKRGPKRTGPPDDRGGRDDGRGKDPARPSRP